MDTSSSIATGTQGTRMSLTTREYLVPFALITALFFLWGIAHGLLDVLNKHFQELLHISKARSGLIQFAMYSAYFSMALPAGYFIKRFGYKRGIILGLSLFAGGCFLIAGTTLFQSFWLFLACLFVLGCGLATLETAANPYTTKLGPPETAERRINLAQSFNGLAWTVGPLIGLFIYGASASPDGNELVSLVVPYTVIGAVVLTVAVVFTRTRLPEISEEEGPASGSGAGSGVYLMKRPHFVLAVAAQFAYVAAQTGIFSYLINFMTDPNQEPHVDKMNGPYLLSVGFALFMVGRMSGSQLMSYIKPAKLLSLYSAACCVLLVLVGAELGWVSVISLYLVFFFMSIMFPTIFALGIKGLGPDTKRASSFIVMSIVGGAVFPPFMGWIADRSTMAVGFLAPIPLFAFILFYAIRGHVIKEGYEHGVS